MCGYTSAYETLHRHSRCQFSWKAAYFSASSVTISALPNAMADLYCTIHAPQNNYSSSIRSILNMTGLVPSEQQHIISFSRFIHPFMIEPPCSPVYIYREMASHASEQCGIFGPPATVFGSADVLTSVFKPPCQK